MVIGSCGGSRSQGIFEVLAAALPATEKTCLLGFRIMVSKYWFLKKVGLVGYR